MLLSAQTISGSAKITDDEATPGKENRATHSQRWDGRDLLFILFYRKFYQEHVINQKLIKCKQIKQCFKWSRAQSSNISKESNLQSKKVTSQQFKFFGISWMPQRRLVSLFHFPSHHSRSRTFAPFLPNSSQNPTPGLDSCPFCPFSFLFSSDLASSLNVCANPHSSEGTNWLDQPIIHSSGAGRGKVETQLTSFSSYFIVSIDLSINLMMGVLESYGQEAQVPRASLRIGLAGSEWI